MAPQLLSVLGQPGTAPTSPRPELTEEQLKHMHLSMVRTRALDERGMLLQRQGRIGFYVPSFGEEAAQIGSAFPANADDWIAPSYRQPGIALLRGVDPEALLDNCFGNGGDNAKGRQMPVHYSFKDANFISISSPIGTQIVQGAGVAMAMRIEKSKKVCLSYFGDGATSSNDFHTGLNFGAVYKAPVIFCCINNQWAISLSVAAQTASETMAQKAEAYGMPGIRVDGNDVLAVYEATRQAVERARNGDGPTLIEYLTFRMGPHSSSDDPSRYRPAEDEAEWKAKDPIERFEAFLENEGVLSRDEMDALHAEAEKEMSAAAKRAEAKPAPELDSIFDDVWAELTPQLDEQREGLRAEGGSHAADEDAAFPL